MKNGSKSEGDFRWTVIWETNGKEWLIVHEHISAPLAQ
jgi:ketosteroid isomerase-like protein